MTTVEVVGLIQATMRMTAGVDLAQGVDVDVSVDLRGLQTGMAQHFLNVADIRSSTMHVSGTGMTKEMAGAPHLDPAAPHQSLDPVAQRAGRNAGSIATEEQGRFVGQVGKEGSGLGEEGLNHRWTGWTQMEVLEGGLIRVRCAPRVVGFPALTEGLES